MQLKPTSSTYRVQAEEVSEALHQRTGFDLISTRDLEGRNSSMERLRLHLRPPYAARSPGRREPCPQFRSVPVAALLLSRRSSSCIRNRSSLWPKHVHQRHRPPPAQQQIPSTSEAPREVKLGHGRARR